MQVRADVQLVRLTHCTPDDTLSRISGYPLATQEPMPENNETSSALSFIGEPIKRLIFSLQDYSLLALQSVVSVITPPTYWTDTLEQMDSIGVGSLWIVALTALFIGAVLVLQTGAEFERFGEKAYTGTAVSLALVRELGPVITALLVAGRNASGIASELGSMVVTEQVDAMRALGTNPLRKLVTPRVVATVLTLPLLVAVADFVGLIGAFAYAYYALGLGQVQFWTRAVNALAFGDLVQGFVKPLVFGFIIATVACHKGLRVRGGTQGVGKATTSAVVVSSVLILVVDFFLGRIFLHIQ